MVDKTVPRPLRKFAEEWVFTRCPDPKQACWIHWRHCSWKSGGKLSSKKSRFKPIKTTKWREHMEHTFHWSMTWTDPWSIPSFLIHLQQTQAHSTAAQSDTVIIMTQLFSLLHPKLNHKMRVEILHKLLMKGPFQGYVGQIFGSSTDWEVYWSYWLSVARQTKACFPEMAGKFPFKSICHICLQASWFHHLMAYFRPYRHEPDPRSWCKRTCPDFYSFFIFKIMQLMAESPSNQLRLVVFFLALEAFKQPKWCRFRESKAGKLPWKKMNPLYEIAFGMVSPVTSWHFHHDSGSYSFAPFDRPKMRDLQNLLFLHNLAVIALVAWQGILTASGAHGVTW